jgi:predicted nucleic acid-binding protein
MSRVLVDTSVWIDHFRHRNSALENLLQRDAVLTHAMVIGEIACCTPPTPRAQTLGDLGALARVQHASMGETLAFIEREAMYGLGCGLVDMVLLASTLMTPAARLWTLDKRLAGLAARFGVEYAALP